MAASRGSRRRSDPDSPPVGLRARKKAEMRRRILRVARERFAERGIEAATMEDIARSAGISRKTCFNYFPRKRAIVAALGMELEASFAVAIERAWSAGDTAAERIACVFAGAAELLLSQPEFYRGVIYESLIDARLRADRRRRARATHESFARIVGEGIERGDVRSDLTAEAAGEIVAGVFIELLQTWVVDPSHPLEERMRGAAKFLGEALAPPRSAPAASQRARRNATGPARSGRGDDDA